MTTEGLPLPPPGSWWAVTGKPRGPWVWSSEIIWRYNGRGFAVGADLLAVASAPGATATLQWEGKP